MPPKKGSSKKPPKVKTPTLIDGLNKDEMTKEQIQEHIVRLREELDREREERNYFQLERDKLHTFRENTERELEEAKAELKNVQRDIEEDERRHQVEIKVYKQKMKHVLCEHQNTIAELKADALVSTEAVQEEQQQLESGLHQEMRTIMANMQELDIESLIKELEQKHDKDMTETRNRLQEQLRDTKAKHQTKIELLKQDLKKGRRKEIIERQDQWNCHVNNLKEDHNKAIAEIDTLVKSFHFDKSIHKTTKELEDTVERTKECMASALEENKHLTEDVSKINTEVTAMERKMKFRTVTENNTERIRTKELHELKQKHEALKQNFSKLQLERDELYETFTQSVQEAQQNAGLKGELLEGKISSMAERLEDTQTQLDLVISASNMDQTAVQELMNQIGESLDSLNDTIKDLQHKKALISKARKDVVLHFEATQRALGVPVQELRVEPDA
ncbi:dynein regulatory complex subunit 4-like [Notolabrus celidotus]|uniref:dynein regulatory complex subunit 4-like n=1 Tax=Notolabrus celidotus TaxID=1203425 RepID=UPI00148F7ABB|nr:dynein regulatory complex subunit 4-like [Notolabrus celidotus]